MSIEPSERGSHPLLDSGVIGLLIAEYDHAKAKHGENTLDGANSNDMLRLAALVEEVGETARELTYDQAGSPAERATRLKSELIDVANVACTWAGIL